VAVGEVRPGYELWRPNREKSKSITTKFVLVGLLAATTLLAALITITGFELMVGGSGMSIICLIYVLLYAFFTFLVLRWNRGILPVVASLSVILAIFCATGANSWFSRDKSGFDEGLISSSAIGVLVIILLILQLVVAAVALYAFNQNWHVEEERPIAGHRPDDEDTADDGFAPAPA